MTIQAAHMRLVRGPGGIAGEPGRFEWWRRLDLPPNGKAPVVIYCHGAGGFQLHGNLEASPQIGQTFVRLANAGCVVFNTELGGATPPFPLGADTWGNDSMLAALTGVVNFALAQRESNAQTKVVLIGHSMGNVSACNWATRNPTKVAGIFGQVPVSDFVTHYNGGVENTAAGKRPTEMNTAYGFPTTPNGATFDPTTLAARSPAAFAASVVALGIPISIGYATDDPQVDNTTEMQPWITALGASIYQTFADTGIGGHGTWPDPNTYTRISALLDKALPGRQKLAP